MRYHHGIPAGRRSGAGDIPYYRTTYALIFKRGSGLEDVTAISDPRLKDKRIGIVAKTPPSTNMAINGLLAPGQVLSAVHRHPRGFLGAGHDRRPRQGNIDCGILWGPMAGYYASQANPPLVVVPLTKETTGPQMTYRIGMAVRAADQEWKRTLNRLIMENQTEINKL
jgi:ABC-type amino acid transport substrate-binding protein